MKRTILIIISISVLLGCGYFVFYKINASKKLAAQEKKLTQVSEEIWKCLSQPKEMVLYSLDPDNEDIKNTEKNVIFHNFKVLGSLKVESPEIQAKIVNEIKSAVSEIGRDFAKCFWPRHGVSVTDGNNVYDFVICYHCHTLYLYQGDAKIKEIVIGSSVEILNGILKNANVPLPEQAK